MQNGEAKYPWESPQADVAEARRLINKHGYWRRREELEDAEAGHPWGRLSRNSIFLTYDYDQR